MMSLVNFDDSKKIGLGLTSFGLFFMGLGVILFFDAALLAMGNILFLSGITFLIGFSRALRFFGNASKWHGSVLFFVGFFLVLFRWSLIGMLLELAGIVRLFGDFVPSVYKTVRSLPMIDLVLRTTGLRGLLDGRLLSSYLPQ
jgi:hypothetical protein